MLQDGHDVGFRGPFLRARRLIEGYSVFMNGCHRATSGSCLCRHRYGHGDYKNCRPYVEGGGR